MYIETKSHKQITKESYQATAMEYSQNVKDLAPLASIDRFIKSLPPKADILDLGCGSGRDAKIFAERGAHVTGVDFSSNLINIAQAHAPTAKFHVMDIEELDFPAQSFDGAWAACSLAHIAKKSMPQVLKRIHHVLTDHGYLYLAVKEGAGEGLEQDSRYNGDIKKFWSYYEEDELRTLLEKAHFKIIDLALVEKNHPYQTHSAFRVYCQKI